MKENIDVWFKKCFEPIVDGRNSVKTKPPKINKPENGMLVFIEGGKETPIPGAIDKPFALLQYFKIKLIKQGYSKKQLKIKYYVKDGRINS